MAEAQLRKCRIIDRRRLFEYVKALVVGGMWLAWIGGFFMKEASAAAEQSGRLPAFEFLGHRIGDSVVGKFPPVGGSGAQPSESRQVLRPAQDEPKSEPYCWEGTGGIGCYGDSKIWSGSSYTVGGVPVDLIYSLPNGKLASLVMTFDSTFHQKIREMLIGKYGRTTYEYAGTVFTAVNQYQNTVTHWQFREGFLVLTEVVVANIGVLNFHPYTVTEESPDPEAIKLRMLGKRTF